MENKLSESLYLYLAVFLFFTCIYLLKKLYEFSMIILRIEESIDTSLDILDDQYKRISLILEKPIFFDSIEVRQVIQSIKNCHHAITLIANNLTNETGIISEISQENQETEERKE